MRGLLSDGWTIVIRAKDCTKALQNKFDVVASAAVGTFKCTNDLHNILLSLLYCEKQPHNFKANTPGAKLLKDTDNMIEWNT